MSKTMLRTVFILPVLLLIVLLMPIGAQKAAAAPEGSLQTGEAAQVGTASTYYYFESPSAGASYKVGDKIPVSFYVGVVRKTTKFDAWGNVSSTTYDVMPVTFKVYKGATEVYSESFTYTKGTTLNTTFIPKTAGTLKLQIYGCNMSLTSTAQVLQDTITITVKKKKATAVKSIKPAVSVTRTAKKAVEITCTNDYGFGMRVYRATKKNGTYKLIKVTAKSTFTDKKIAATKAYYYKVRLYAKSGKKTYLSKWSYKKLAGKYKPGVTLTYTASKGVKVTWSKITGAGYYLVYRNNAGVGKEYECISCEDKATTTFYDKDVVKGKTYYYGVVAEKGDAEPVGKHFSNAFKIKIPS